MAEGTTAGGAGFDDLIVGAGSAGATLAARLSEDPGRRVLLLEAGRDYRPAERPFALSAPNPQLVLYGELSQTYLWPALQARRTEAQPPRFFWRGRGVGGSSSINGQIAIRGTLEDHDRWAAAGCAGWSGAEVLPAYIRLEDDLDFGDAPYHGCGGPIPVYRAPLEHWGATDRALHDAALAEGYGFAPDHNAPGSSGVSPYAINSRDGVRVSTADAYLEPARGRPNLTILGGALVDRVLFAGRRAIGVRARIAGQWHELLADEVLLSAGAIHSPAILQRSGVGEPSHLRALGIAPLAALPAGEHLLDHPGLSLAIPLNEAARIPEPGFRHTNCCVRYSSGLCGAGQNDMILIAFNSSGVDAAGMACGRYLVSAFQAWSEGSVRIVSDDPEADPQVEERMLSDERDLVRMRDGVLRLLRLAEERATRAICADPARITLGMRGTPLSALQSDAALDALLMAEVSDAQHASGTCRMGRVDDPRSVVDSDCRVLGLERLRVIDASIMPEVTRSNTHLPTVMIAEQMAARLR